MGIQVRLDNVVIDYPVLFEARLYKGKYKFSGTFLVEKGGEMDDRIKAAIEEAKASYPGKKLEEVYYDGDAKYPDNKHYAGKMFIRAAKNRDQGPPTAYSMDNQKLTAMDQATIYRGSLVNAYVDAYVPKSPNDDKVCFGLTAVQHAGEGERIIGENDVDPDTLFKPLTTEAKKPSFL